MESCRPRARQGVTLLAPNTSPHDHWLQLHRERRLRKRERDRETKTHVCPCISLQGLCVCIPSYICNSSYLLSFSQIHLSFVTFRVQQTNTFYWDLFMSGTEPATSARLEPFTFTLPSQLEGLSQCESRADPLEPSSQSIQNSNLYICSWLRRALEWHGERSLTCLCLVVSVGWVCRPSFFQAQQ